jgi:hypothetical protein
MAVRGEPVVEQFGVGMGRMRRHSHWLRAPL